MGSNARSTVAVQYTSRLTQPITCCKKFASICKLGRHPGIDRDQQFHERPVTIVCGSFANREREASPASKRLRRGAFNGAIVRPRNEQQDDEKRHDATIEALAQESGQTIGVVAEVYRAEFARLSEEASVYDFVALFAARRTRAVLRNSMRGRDRRPR
jgi:hypothetical protein